MVTLSASVTCDCLVPKATYDKGGSTAQEGEQGGMNKNTPPRRGLAGQDVIAGVRPGAGVLGLARPDTTASAAAADEDSTEGRLIVGEGIHVKGEIQSCRTLIVEGTVEASLEARELTVNRGGVYSGKAAVAEASVDGRFDGELTVEGLLTIRAGGRVSGKLRYCDLKIEQGGRISGDVDSLAEAAGATAAPPPAEAAAEEPLRGSAAAR